MVDDRRRRADSPRLPPSLRRTASQAGGSQGARRDDRRHRRHMRCRALSAGLKPDERRFIQASPVDVEDWGMMTLTFSDATKATIFACDTILGGVRNLVETYTTGGVLIANIAPNNHMVSYLTDESKLDGVYGGRHRPRVRRHSDPLRRLLGSRRRAADHAVIEYR